MNFEDLGEAFWGLKNSTRAFGCSASNLWPVQRFSALFVVCFTEIIRAARRPRFILGALITAYTRAILFWGFVISILELYTARPYSNY